MLGMIGQDLCDLIFIEYQSSRISYEISLSPEVQCVRDYTDLFHDGHHFPVFDICEGRQHQPWRIFERFCTIWNSLWRMDG